MNACPVCGTPVDPVRAPAAAVRDGKIISYCSKAHAAEAETKPTAIAPGRARTPASGVVHATAPLESGPVIEILHEPASGVVTSAADARTGAVRPSPSSGTSGAIQIADTGHLDDYVSLDPGGKRTKGWILAVVIVALALGAAATAAYKLGAFGQAAAPPASAGHE